MQWIEIKSEKDIPLFFDKIFAVKMKDGEYRSWVRWNNKHTPLQFYNTLRDTGIVAWLDETDTPEPTGSGWIDADTLPENKGERVLTFDSNGSYNICYLNQYSIWVSIFTGIEFTKLITHWQPLPPKP